VIAASIEGRTRYLGAPADWVPDERGPCGRLAIRDEITTAGLSMASAWEPTPEEIDRISKGAKVILWVIGSMHPPVALSVGNVPDRT
jgi:hypothetical protein